MYAVVLRQDRYSSTVTYHDKLEDALYEFNHGQKNGEYWMGWVFYFAPGNQTTIVSFDHEWHGQKRLHG